jgi:hypothetical protein
MNVCEANCNDCGCCTVNKDCCWAWNEVGTALSGDTVTGSCTNIINTELADSVDSVDTDDTVDKDSVDTDKVFADDTEEYF